LSDSPNANEDVGSEREEENDETQPLRLIHDLVTRSNHQLAESQITKSVYGGVSL